MPFIHLGEGGGKGLAPLGIPDRGEDEDLPMVVIPNGVSGSAPRRSRMGRSITSARLFPCFASVLIMATSVGALL